MRSPTTQRGFDTARALPRRAATGGRRPAAAGGWRRGALCALAAALLCAPAALTAAPLAMLLGAPAASVSSQTAATTATPDRTVARERAVAVDFRQLDPRSTAAPAALGVELFDGQIVTLERAGIEQRAPGNYTWQGRVRGYERSEAVLTVVDGQIAGTIVVVDAGLRSADTYQLQSRPGGTQSLRRLDPAGFPPDHPPGSEGVQAPPHAAGAAAGGVPDQGAPGAVDATDATALADSGDTIDVMVVYGNQTAAAAATTIAAEIQHAVDRANLAYANSGVGTRLRLVHYRQLAYNESGNFNTDLNRLTNGGDGYMDDVPALRDTHGADLVSLFVENGQYCGIAWLGPNAGYGFSVVNRGCAGGYLSFAHELGHNIGARHDPYVDSSSGYAHGYTYPAARWRTVMAYNDACAAAGTSCTRIPYFSSPLVSYGSPAVPMGTTTLSDNTRLHNLNATTVANFRAAAGTVCTYALTPGSASVAAGGGTGSVALAAGATCPWTIGSSAAWLTVSSATSGSGSATVSYAVAANTGASRSANLTAGGATFLVTQAAPVVTTPIATLSATAIVFSAQRVGKASAAKSVTLKNTGSGTLTVSALTQGGANPGDFTRSGTCAAGTALAAAQTCTITYRFKPAAKGARSAGLAVATSGGSVNLALSGTGK